MEQAQSELARADLGPGVRFKLKGEDEEREKAGAFLMKAFGTAIFLIFAILLAQFNKLISVGLVLTAVVLSTFGVLLGLLIMGQPFGVVMTGIGVIANAGVIVNNNIVLIDTYDRLRREGREARVGGYGSWWDVPVAETSSEQSVRDARAPQTPLQTAARTFGGFRLDKLFKDLMSGPAGFGGARDGPRPARA